MLEALNELWLLSKVILSSGSCRNDDLMKLTVGDIQYLLTWMSLLKAKNSKRKSFLSLEVMVVQLNIVIRYKYILSYVHMGGDRLLIAGKYAFEK